MSRNALGRGLSSLLGEGNLDLSLESLRSRGQVQAKVPIETIQTNPWQPRRQFDDASLEELAESIRVHGVLQPLLLRRQTQGEGFVLIAGERRLRAARLAGLTEVPSLILDAGDVETLAIALTENIQRSDLNPIEQAHGYGILRDQFGLTQEEIADRVSKPRSTVANYLRLLSLPAEVQEAVLSGEISMGHARALAGLTHEEVCLIALDKVVRLGLNVRATEELCQRLSEAGSPQEAEGAPGLGTIDPNILALEEALRDHLGTPVRVQPSGRKGGKVIIQYFDLEQLDEILRRMGIRFDS